MENMISLSSFRLYYLNIMYLDYIINFFTEPSNSTVYIFTWSKKMFCEKYLRNLVKTSNKRVP